MVNCNRNAVQVNLFRAQNKAFCASDPRFPANARGDFFPIAGPVWFPIPAWKGVKARAESL